MALKVGELFATIGLDTTQFDKAIKDSGGLLESFGKKLSVAATGAALWSTGKQVVQTAVDYETAFAGVRKTVEATEEEYAALSAQIIEMSKIKPATASNIAGVVEIAGQLGVAKEDVLNFADTMTDLGESTNLSAVDAADILAKLSSAMGILNPEYDRMGATIVELGNNFATTESDIANMSLRLASAGSALGMSVSDIMALSTAMSSVGISAELGGSNMSTFLFDMQNAIASGGDKLQKFASIAGMSAEEFSAAFKADAAGAFLKFVQGLPTGDELAVVLPELGVNSSEMARMLTSMVSASDLLAESLVLGNTAWDENTALAEEAAKRYETTASQFQILENKITALGQKFGDALLGPVNAVVDTLSGWLDEIIAAVEWLQQNFTFGGDWWDGGGSGAIAEDFLTPEGMPTVDAYKLLGEQFNMSQADVDALGIDELRAKIEEALANMNTVGANGGDALVDGMAFKIESGAGRVYSATQKLANSANQAMQDTLQIHSPSKVSGRIADFYVDGFVNNVMNGRKLVSKASSALAKSAAAGLSISPLRGVSTFANSYARSEQNGLAGLIPALADAMAQRPANMYAKGRLIAQTLAPENQSAINQRSSRIAFGYGGR